MPSMPKVRMWQILLHHEKTSCFLSGRFFIAKNHSRMEKPYGCVSVSKKLRRICRFCGKPIQIHFPPGRVPGGKYFSDCKCIVCSPEANKLCAQQAAKNLSKSPKGDFRQSATAVWKNHTAVFLYRRCLRLAKSNPAVPVRETNRMPAHRPMLSPVAGLVFSSATRKLPSAFPSG